jgi:predicted DNA-binding antitoxin AbrB/MazE fold protein
MKTTTPWARRPSVQALRRPVSAVLGGANSPAAFSLSLSLSAGSRLFIAAAPAVYYFARFAFSLGVEIMALTIEAVNENGVLKPIQPLPLKEHEKVRITVELEQTWAERTAGMLQWTGAPEVLRRIAEDDEFSILEPL